MDDRKKEGRYQRIFVQLSELIKKSSDHIARMATVCAVLHHKMDHFFWTGFYLLNASGKLVVGPYQGPVACQELEAGKGVCWAAIERQEPVLVDDVNCFPGHVACDSRSQSEITIPVKDKQGVIRAVFDVDSDRKGSFSEVDSLYLQKIVALIYS